MFSLLIYGNFASGHLAASYARAFEKLGCQVTPFDTREMKAYLNFWLSNRVLHRVTINSLLWRRIGSIRWNQRLIERALNARVNAVFITNGEFVMPETIKYLRTCGIYVLIFHADNPFPPHYNHRPETLLCAQMSDMYFIWSRSLLYKLQSVGVKHVHYLPFAWDADVFTSLEITSKKYDVIFVGNWDRDRERWLEPLVKYFDLKIWGTSYWMTRTRQNSPLRACWQGSAILEEASQVIRDARIVLNILRRQNLPDGVIMRTFEVPGCGSFLLSTRTQGALEIFPEGHSGAYFNTPSELIKQIDYYLKHEDKREAIARRAHLVVKNSGHQYINRASEILKALKKLSQ